MDRNEESLLDDVLIWVKRWKCLFRWANYYYILFLRAINKIRVARKCLFVYLMQRLLVFYTKEARPRHTEHLWIDRDFCGHNFSAPSIFLIWLAGFFSSAVVCRWPHNVPSTEHDFIQRVSNMKKPPWICNTKMSFFSCSQWQKNNIYTH